MRPAGPGGRERSPVLGPSQAAVTPGVTRRGAQPAAATGTTPALLSEIKAEHFETSSKTGQNVGE